MPRPKKGSPPPEKRETTVIKTPAGFRTIVKQYAKKAGMSTNAYVLAALDAKMLKDEGEDNG